MTSVNVARRTSVSVRCRCVASFFLSWLAGAPPPQNIVESPYSPEHRRIEARVLHFRRQAGRDVSERRDGILLGHRLSSHETLQQNEAAHARHIRKTVGGVGKDNLFSDNIIFSWRIWDEDSSDDGQNGLILIGHHFINKHQPLLEDQFCRTSGREHSFSGFKFLPQQKDLHIQLPQLHVPDGPVVRVHPRGGNLSPRHQAAEFVGGRQNTHAEAVRFRVSETTREGRAQRCLHLQSLLSGAGADIRGDRLHDGHRHMVRRLCNRRNDPGPAIVPRRVRRRPIGGDHQGGRMIYHGRGRVDSGEGKDSVGDGTTPSVVVMKVRTTGKNENRTRNRKKRLWIWG